MKRYWTRHRPVAAVFPELIFTSRAIHPLVPWKSLRSHGYTRHQRGTHRGRLAGGRRRPSGSFELDHDCQRRPVRSCFGAGLSLIGSLGAALVGFFIGRHGEQVLARFVPSEERSRANRMLDEWGVLAIIVTRPIPLLAETTAIMAGASTMGWRSMILATLAGSFPVAVLYALTGATAANLDSAILAFGLSTRRRPLLARQASCACSIFQ